MPHPLNTVCVAVPPLVRQVCNLPSYGLFLPNVVRAVLTVKVPGLVILLAPKVCYIPRCSIGPGTTMVVEPSFVTPNAPAGVT